MLLLVKRPQPTLLTTPWIPLIGGAQDPPWLVPPGTLVKPSQCPRPRGLARPHCPSSARQRGGETTGSGHRRTQVRVPSPQFAGRGPRICCHTALSLLPLSAK